MTTASCEKPIETSLTVSSKTRHELLNWLNQIVGYSEILSEEVDANGNDKILSDLDRLNSAAQQLSERLETLLSCAQVCNSRLCGAVPNNKQFPLARKRTQKTSVDEHKITGRILVVDDNPDNREILSRRLKRQGYQVVLADNGKQALEMLRLEPFDLVLLDILMPDMNGHQVLQTIKADEKLRNIPVIMISACADIDYVIMCIEAGAEDYLPKPFNPTLLKARINATLEKKRLREQELKFISQTMQTEAALDRHRVLSQAVAGVAHEINTPLGIVNIGLSIINNRLNLPEIQQLFKANSSIEALLNDMLETSMLTVKNVEIAHKLIQNFKKIAIDQQITESKVSSDLPGLLQEAIDLFKISSKQSKIEVVLDVSGIKEGRAWFGVPGDLTQIIMNFLQNIERYAYPDGMGGKVEITVVDQSGSDKAGHFVLTIHDYGAGISPDCISKIFEPFFTTGRSKGGTGLGLAIVNNIVTVAMQGTLSVSSELGFGTCFTVCIPKNLNNMPDSSEIQVLG